MGEVRVEGLSVCRGREGPAIGCEPMVEDTDADRSLPPRGWFVEVGGICWLGRRGPAGKGGRGRALESRVDDLDSLWLNSWDVEEPTG